jgi:hypothetical protein
MHAALPRIFLVLSRIAVPESTGGIGIIESHCTGTSTLLQTSMMIGRQQQIKRIYYKITAEIYQKRESNQEDKSPTSLLKPAGQEGKQPHQHCSSANHPEDKSPKCNEEPQRDVV